MDCLRNPNASVGTTGRRKILTHQMNSKKTMKNRPKPLPRTIGWLLFESSFAFGSLSASFHIFALVFIVVAGTTHSDVLAGILALAISKGLTMPPDLAALWHSAYWAPRVKGDQNPFFGFSLGALSAVGSPFILMVLILNKTHRLGLEVPLRQWLQGLAISQQLAIE